MSDERDSGTSLVILSGDDRVHLPAIPERVANALHESFVGPRDILERDLRGAQIVKPADLEQLHHRISQWAEHAGVCSKFEWIIVEWTSSPEAEEVGRRDSFETLESFLQKGLSGSDPLSRIQMNHSFIMRTESGKLHSYKLELNINARGVWSSRQGAARTHFGSREVGAFFTVEYAHYIPATALSDIVEKWFRALPEMEGSSVEPLILDLAWRGRGRSDELKYANVRDVFVNILPLATALLFGYLAVSIMELASIKRTDVIFTALAISLAVYSMSRWLIYSTVSRLPYFAYSIGLPPRLIFNEGDQRRIEVYRQRLARFSTKRREMRRDLWIRSLGGVCLGVVGNIAFFLIGKAF